MAEQQRLQEEKEAQEKARAEHEENLRLQKQVSTAFWVMETTYSTLFLQPMLFCLNYGSNYNS